MATPNDFASIVSDIYQGMVDKGYTGTEADLAIALSALSDDNGATTKWIDLGASSAYAIAVEHGYTGTEDEWIALLMNITQNAQIAKDSADSAAESAESAKQSEEAIPSKKEEALQAIASAESDALQSVNTAGQAQVQTVNAAGATQVGLVQQEGSDQKDVVIAEGEKQTQRVSSQGILEVQAVANEGTRQTGLVTDEGDAQVTRVKAEGTTQVGLVTAEGSTQVGNVSQEGADQIAAIEQKGIDTRASIPPDYTALSDDVSALKSAIAPEYDATATYIKDSFVRKDGKLYHNTEPITTPEAWTASHWREVYVGAELTDLSQRADVLEWLARSRGLTPAQLQQIAASGHADEYFDIGDVIFIPWTDKTPAEPVTYDYPFVVVAFRDCVDANGVTHKNALWIQALYATPQAIAFDAPEQVIADETTFQPDTYYYTKEGSDWHQEEVTVGDPIPSGETYWKHYRSGMAGRIRYGSNDYEESAYRQWLNSDGDEGDWWTAQHASDVAPAQAATVPGWLTGFTEDWLAIFQPVEVKQAKNTVCDGGETAVMYDKFFLPSISELYGSQSLAAIEGAYWPYWKEATGLPSPTNGSSSNTNDARKIPQVSAPEGSAVTVRLRSAFRSNTYNVWNVSSAGYLSAGYYAYSAYRALPACVIFESTNVGA